jgi:hypothetical protein
MALLVSVGLSLRLAHDVARHLGPYRERGVLITCLLQDQNQTATDAERTILRTPGRALVAATLHALHDQATAAATLIDDAHISDLTVSKVTAGQIVADWVVGARIKREQHNFVFTCCTTDINDAATAELPANSAWFGHRTAQF